MKECYICGKRATEKTKYFKEDSEIDRRVDLCRKHFEFIILINISKNKRFIEETDLKWLKEEIK